MMKSMKRLILTGAAVTVMMSLATPAMAEGKDQGHLNEPSETTVIVDPVKDPGKGDVGIIVDPIREPYKDPGIRSCDLTPSECPNTDTDHDTKDSSPVDEEPYKDPGMIGYSETNPSPVTYGCPYDDYYYVEEDEVCAPTGAFLGPWPDSVGGYVGLPGKFGADMLTGLGFGMDKLLGHDVGDALVDFGEDGGPIGWGIQGIGYTIDFTGQTLGVLTEGLGEILDSVSDTVSEAIDDAWDEISSWF
jgi:hypothetical protein